MYRLHHIYPATGENDREKSFEKEDGRKGMVNKAAISAFLTDFVWRLFLNWHTLLLLFGQWRNLFFCNFWAYFLFVVFGLCAMCMQCIRCNTNLRKHFMYARNMFVIFNLKFISFVFSEHEHTRATFPFTVTFYGIRLFHIYLNGILCNFLEYHKIITT